MDLLLESLRNIYADIDEEESILEHIENIILQPDTLFEEPEYLTDPEQEDPEEPIDEPVQVEPEKPKSDALPDISSKMKTPPKKNEPPVIKKPVSKLSPKPVSKATPGAPEKPSNTPSVTPSVAPSGIVPPNSAPATQSIPQPASITDPTTNKIIGKLSRLSKAGKQYSSPLNSTALSNMVYDPRSKKLVVTFTKNGRSYEYGNVSLSKAAALITSNQKGTLFNRSIKQTSPAKEVT